MTSTADLVLERREQSDKTLSATEGNTTVLITPPVSEDYWKYRVRVADGQAVVGFPKFGTIGIGFAEEEDWNTNLPYTGDAESIRRHIWHNRDDEFDSTYATFRFRIRSSDLREEAQPEGQSMPIEEVWAAFREIAVDPVDTDERWQEAIASIEGRA